MRWDLPPEDADQRRWKGEVCCGLGVPQVMRRDKNPFARAALRLRQVHLHATGRFPTWCTEHRASHLAAVSASRTQTGHTHGCASTSEHTDKDTSRQTPTPASKVPELKKGGRKLLVSVDAWLRQEKGNRLNRPPACTTLARARAARMRAARARACPPRRASAARPHSPPARTGAGRAHPTAHARASEPPAHTARTRAPI